MTKQDYKIVAEILRAAQLPLDTRRKLVNEFGDKFTRLDSKFDFEMFCRQALPPVRPLEGALLPPKDPNGVRHIPGKATSGGRPIDFQYFNSAKALGL